AEIIEEPIAGIVENDRWRRNRFLDYGWSSDYSRLSYHCLNDCRLLNEFFDNGRLRNYALDYDRSLNLPIYFDKRWSRKNRTHHWAVQLLDRKHLAPCAANYSWAFKGSIDHNRRFEHS